MSPSEMQNIASNLERVATRDLSAELRRRGYDVLPAGLLQFALNDANHQAGDVREPSEDELEALALLARIAGSDFPKLVQDHGTVLEDNLELSRRARRAEAEAALLAGVLVGSEIDEMEGKEDE